MPNRPPHPCGYPRCPHLTDARFCTAHQSQERKRVDERRGSSTERGYGSKWRTAARGHLSRNPLCWYCTLVGRVTAATCVDHHVPHRGDWALFWDKSNWRSSCGTCHSTKTASEDGGFGNAIRSAGAGGQND